MTYVRPELEIPPQASPAARAFATRAVPLLQCGALVSILALWASSLHAIEPRRTTNIGLIGALPASFYAAVALLTASFAFAISRPRLTWLLPAHIGVQVLIFFGTMSFVEYGPRTQSAWRLAGIVDYVTQHHGIDRNIDAFFNWPGYFILQSFITQVSGLENAVDLARWAPLFFNLAYAPALLVILRTLALRERQVWVGLWLFFAGNWIGQDYLAPQAFGYLVYLTIIALLLRAFPPVVDAAYRRAWRWIPLGPTASHLVPSGPTPPAGAAPREETGLTSPGRRAATIALVLALCASVAPSHQLTPWMIASGTAAISIAQRRFSFGLPVVMVLIAATWVVFFAGPYLSGHFSEVATAVGSVGGNVEANLGKRIGGNAGHLLVVRARVGFTLALMLLAVVGGLRLWRARLPVRTIVALAIAPFLAIALQTYGGEVLLRCYLFSLPFLALAGAAALEPLLQPQRSARRLVATLLLLAVAFAFLLTRYGNEKMDFFTKEEVTAVEFLYRTAPPGARLVGVTDNVPWRFVHYADYDYDHLESSDVTRARVDSIVNDLKSARQPTYLLITRSQFAAGEILEGWPANTEATLRHRLLKSSQFRVLLQNRDATVLELASNAPPRERVTG
jgi:hypothetical protein